MWYILSEDSLLFRDGLISYKIQPPVFLFLIGYVPSSQFLGLLPKPCNKSFGIKTVRAHLDRDFLKMRNLALYVCGTNDVFFFNLYTLRDKCKLAINPKSKRSAILPQNMKHWQSSAWERRIYLLCYIQSQLSSYSLYVLKNRSVDACAHTTLDIKMRDYGCKRFKSKKSLWKYDIELVEPAALKYQSTVKPGLSKNWIIQKTLQLMRKIARSRHFNPRKPLQVWNRNLYVRD